MASANLAGTYGNAVTLNNAGNSISGNGSGLTSLNASQLTSIGNTNGPAAGNFYVGPAGNTTTRGSDNTAMGDLAFSNNATGSYNTAIGFASLSANTSGSGNLAAGYGALAGNTSGQDNTASGYGALVANTIGSFNVANGVSALVKNTAGSYNLASGLEALYSNTNGDENVAEGYGALYANLSGSENTAVGGGALSALGVNTGAGGTNNIALGYNAGGNFNANESGNIDIGSPGVPGDNNVIRLGTPGIQTNTFIAGTLYGDGGGLTNLNAAQLSGTIPPAQLPAVMVTNFETGVTLSNLTATGTLIFPPYDVTPLDIFAGTNLLLATGAEGSFYFGPKAGNTNNNAIQSTAFGYSALNSITTGGNDTAVGNGALRFNTSGNDNTAVGLGALYINKTGNDNTANGFAALNENVTGSNNVAVGSGALAFLGNATVGGSGNIALGYNAGSAYTANESGNILIGHVGVVGENNIIRIGTPGVQATTYIAGVISGNGGGLTNLNAAQLSGSVPATVLAGFQAPNYAAIGGGQGNSISSGTWATISGGQNNSITGGNQTTIGGGIGNVVSAIYATVAGGQQNTNSSSAGSIGGGQNNIASGPYQATVGGGYQNTASGNYATVPGGFQNVAGGVSSLAAGAHAQAANDGTFVWADNSTSGSFASTGNNQFLIRASGNVGINTTTPGSELTLVQANAGGRGAEFSLVNNAASTTGNEVAINFATDPSTYNGDNPNAQIKSRCVNGANGANDLVFSTYNGSIFQETMHLTNSGSLYVRGTVYANGVALTSDRNAKEHFTAVNGREVLAKVAALPVTEWNYKTDSQDVQHIGPMAQDFQAAFGVNGADDKHISVVDEGGVALAAIQGLNQKLEVRSQELEDRSKQLSAENAELKSRLEKLEQLVAEKIGGAK